MRLLRQYDQDIATRLQDAAEKVPENIGGSIGGVVGVAGSVVASIFSTVTVIVLTVYFSISLQQIRHGSLRLVPRSKRQRFQDLLDPILTKIGAYIAGNVVISVIAGITAYRRAERKNALLLVASLALPLTMALAKRLGRWGRPRDGS